MKRIAIFVEGYTESFFVVRLLGEIYGDDCDVHDIILQGSYRLTELSQDGVAKYQFLVVNCSSGSAVKSRINQNYQALQENGYDAVLGLYDVYPDNNMLKEYENNKYIGINEKDLPVRITISVMEIEAWFIAEYSHFLIIDKTLTPEKIMEEMALDVVGCDVELIEKPAVTLGEIYKLVGKSYPKKRYALMDTVYRLDYAEMFMNIRHRVPHFGEFLGYIEEFSD